MNKVQNDSGLSLEDASETGVEIAVGLSRFRVPTQAVAAMRA
jgi:hypothetical protein